MNATAPSSIDLVTIFLAGDVMMGRGVDQIMAHSCDPELREPYVKDARTYVELAEQIRGPLPTRADPAYVWGDGLLMLERMQPHVSIVNLETSITTSSEFWPDKAVHYRMHPRNIGALTVPRIDVCALANNHLLDFGRSGLLETLDTLSAVGIQTVGAGRNLDEARRPARVVIGEGRAVLVFAFGSTSSGIPVEWAAGPQRSGVYLLPDLTLATARELGHLIGEHAKAGDIVIASMHWGSNWGFGVSAEQVSFAHQLIEQGVDLVHGHSSHHVRPIEVFDRKLILYGCGDLITDYEGIRGNEEWRGDLGAMYFARLSPRDGTIASLRVGPLQPQKMRLTRPDRADRDWLRTTMSRISRPFGAELVQESKSLLALRHRDLVEATTSAREKKGIEHASK